MSVAELSGNASEEGEGRGRVKLGRTDERSKSLGKETLVPQVVGTTLVEDGSDGEGVG